MTHVFAEAVARSATLSMSVLAVMSPSGDEGSLLDSDFAPLARWSEGTRLNFIGDKLMDSPFS